MKYYLAKVEIFDDSNGKTIKEQVLLEADSVHEAEVQLTDHMKSSINTYEIVSINKTQIASVVKYKDKQVLVS